MAYGHFKMTIFIGMTEQGVITCVNERKHKQKCCIDITGPQQFPEEQSLKLCAISNEVFHDIVSSGVSLWQDHLHVKSHS